VLVDVTVEVSVSKVARHGLCNILSTALYLRLPKAVIRFDLQHVRYIQTLT
jgi:hypothetical protein